MRAATALVALMAGCAASTVPPTLPSPPPRVPHGEPLRLSGELPPAPASAGPPGTLVEGRYEVCLDNGGRVSSVKPLESIAGADEAVISALHGWSWFVVHEEQAPSCFPTTVHLAVPSPSLISRQAGSGVFATIVHNVMAAPPQWLASAYAGKIVDGMYKVCIGETGLVQSVRPIAGVPGADDVFIAGLRASTWDLRVGPLAVAPFCFGAPVRLDQRNLPASVAVPPPLPDPPELARPEHGVSIVMLLHRVAGSFPHLPDELKLRLRDAGTVYASYRQCIAADGSVISVEPLHGIEGADRDAVAVLQKWRYEVRGPAGLGVCNPVALAYTITRGR
ncbi:MAG: hypothetical protein JWN44_4772 [Myxococcales bacterium]|nr:hypothetical protein [Myxococcales bacterium]